MTEAKEAITYLSLKRELRTISENVASLREAILQYADRSASSALFIRKSMDFMKPDANTLVKEVVQFCTDVDDYQILLAQKLDREVILPAQNVSLS